MTKKDYELIASVFNEEITSNNGYNKVLGATAKRLAEGLADKLEQESTRFDRDKFLTACGIRTERGEDRLAELLKKHEEVGYTGLTSAEQQEFDQLYNAE